MASNSSIPMTAGAGLLLLAVGLTADALGGMGLGSVAATFAVKGLALGAGGAAGNAVWDSLKAGASKVGERLRDPRQRLANHDLQALAGRAIAVVIAAAAKDCPGGGAGRKYLQRVAQRFPDAWSSATLDPRFDALLDHAIPKYFGTTDGSKPTTTALTAELWQFVVGSLAGKELDDYELAALHHAAQRLHEQFPRALFELAKEDFDPASTDSPHDGKAFAALLLSLIRDTMGGIGEVLAKQDEAIAGNAQVLGELKTLNQALVTRGEHIARLAPADIAAIVQPITVQIATTHKDVTERLARIEAHARAADEQSKRAADNTDALKVDTADIKAMLAQLLADRPQVAAAVAAQSAAKPPPARTAVGVTNIPAPEPHWIHRQEITRGIRAMLRSGDGTASLTAAVATAAGGYGKTFAARIYAFEHAGDYPGGRFEVTMDKGDLQAQLASLLPLLSPGADLPPSQAAPAVRAILEEAPASLLVLDNVPNLVAWQEHIASGLVPGGHCHVLLTTREADVLPGRAVQVPRFTTEEAWTILARARPDALDEANVKWVGRVLRAADGLGVAIGAVAARMQSSPGTSWNDYWRALTQAAPTLLADSALPPLLRAATSEPDAAQKARWHALLDDCFAALPPALQRALEYTALMPPDLMPKMWLTSLMDDDNSVVPPANGSSVVADLLSMQLLTPADAAGNLLSLHRLWHDRVNQKAEDDDVDRTPLLLAIAACAAERRKVVVGTNADGTERGINNPAALTDGGLRWELTPLAAFCRGLWEAGQLGEAARVGVWLTGLLRLFGRFTDAAACLQLSPASDAAIGAAIGRKKLSVSYSNLAGIQQALGDTLGARASMERAISIDQTQLAPDHPTFAVRYSNLATIQRDLGDLLGARESMEAAISIQQKHLAPDDSGLAISYSNLALIQKEQGDLAGARANMERAIAIQRKHFAPDHPTFATRYSNLATIQMAQGDLPGARASIERAIAIQQKHFAADHPTFATSYSNLAMIQKDQGDRPAARASMERALAIEERAFAPDHPTIAVSYANIAAILAAQGDLDSAESYLRRALAILLKHFNEGHPHVRAVHRSLQNIGRSS